MKNVNLYNIALILMLGFSSCENENIENNQSENKNLTTNFAHAKYSF